jgi:hypothetical protein
MISTWEQGDVAGAVKRFLQTDWTARPLFPAESPLSLSEDQFRALSTAERETVSAQVIKQLDTFKALTRAVAGAAREAAARGDTAQARKCYQALQQCGDALSSPNSMLIVQLVGKALNKMAATEATKLP